MEREEERRGEWIARNVVSGQKLRRTKFSSDKFSVNELNFSKIFPTNFFPTRQHNELDKFP